MSESPLEGEDFVREATKLAWENKGFIARTLHAIYGMFQSKPSPTKHPGAGEDEDTTEEETSKGPDGPQEDERGEEPEDLEGDETREEPEGDTGEEASPEEVPGNAGPISGQPPAAEESPGPFGQGGPISAVRPTGQLRGEAAPVEQPPGILIIGPGGTGKTTLARVLTGHYHRTLFDLPGEYNESDKVETYSLEGPPRAEVVVPPGQSRHRDRDWGELFARLAAGSFRGIILVAANGYYPGM